MRLAYTLLIVVLLIAFNNAFAQSNDKLAKPDSVRKMGDRNDVRIGFYITRVSFAYDRVGYGNKMSLGAEALVHLGNFPGFVGGIVGRYYFNEFNKTGFFLEEKLSYGVYSLSVADTIQINNVPAGSEYNESFKYFCNTASMGFRVFIDKFIFLEFLGGVRAGILSGNTNKYMSIDSNILVGGSTNTVAKEFNSIGPGYPLYFNIRLGTTF